MSCVHPLLAHPPPFLPGPFAALIYPKCFPVFLSSSKLLGIEMEFDFALYSDKCFSSACLPPMDLLGQQQWDKQLLLPFFQPCRQKLL